MKYVGSSNEAWIPAEIDGKPVMIIGSESFLGSFVSVVHIPGCVVKIDHCAFADCANLKDINIPKSIMSIGSYAFRDCHSLSYASIMQILEVCHYGDDILPDSLITPDYEDYGAFDGIDRGIDYGYLEVD